MTSSKVFQQAGSHRIATSVWSLVILLLFAFAIRLVNINARPLWYDEAFAILYAEKPFDTMLYGTITPVEGAAADVHPLFYYSLLHAWTTVGGQAPGVTRLLSVYFGLLTVGMTYVLGKYLFNHRVGLAAAVLVTLAPFAVYYSQETRMYALLGFTAVTATTFFVRAWREKRWLYWLLFGIFSAGTLYAHNLGAMYLFALALWVFYQWLRQRRLSQFWPWFTAQCLALILFTPWLLILPAQMGKIQQAYWVSRPDLTTLLQTLLIFHFAYDNQALPPWLLPFALFFSLLIVVILLLELRRQRKFEPTANLSGAVSLLAVLAFVPILLTFLISQVQPVYIVRALLPSAIAYYLLLSGVLFSDRVPAAIRWLAIIPTLIIIALSLFNHYTYQQFPRAPFVDAITYWHQAYDPASDVIVHSNKLTFFPAHLDDRDLPQSFLADPPGSPSDTLAYPTQEALQLFATEGIDTAVADAERVWFVVFNQELEQQAELGTPHPQLTWLDEHFTLEDQKAFGDLRVFLYSR